MHLSLDEIVRLGKVPWLWKDMGMLAVEQTTPKRKWLSTLHDVYFTK